MRIIAAIADKAGCANVRIKQPADTIMAMDDSITIEPIRRDHFTATKDGRVTSVSEDFLSASVLIMQRPMIPLQLQLMRVARQAGVATVVEIDDDLHALHKKHPLRKGLKPVHLAALKACAAEADLVTCSTETLARRYARHGRYRVVKNYVPRAYTEIPALGMAYPTEPLIVGWAGSLASHPTDLKATQGGVGRALSQSDAIFRVLGRPERVAQDLGITKPIESGWVEQDQYPYELAKFDIGIAPLDSIVFNRSKSHLKPLEMASVGVPVLMSAVGEYKALPFGLQASTPDEWRGLLELLLRNQNYRHEVALQGRQTVRDLYLLENHAHEWTEAWEQAISNAKVKVAA